MDKVQTIYWLLYHFQSGYQFPVKLIVKRLRRAEAIDLVDVIATQMMGHFLTMVRGDNNSLIEIVKHEMMLSIVFECKPSLRPPDNIWTVNRNRQK